MNVAQVPHCPQAEQSVGWALRALEPAEEVEATAHLPTCESCRELVGQVTELLATLGGSAPTLEPPAALRARLLARIAETPQRPKMESATTIAAATPRSATPPQPHAAPAPAHHPERAETDADRKPTQLPPHRWRVALVAAVVSIALAIGGLALRAAEVDQVHTTATSQAQQLARLRSELQRPGAKAAALFPASGTPVAAVLVSDGKGEVITAGLSPNDSAASTYVLWGTGSGPPRALGTFDITAADDGLHRVGPVNGTDSFTGYAISLEPGRTAPGSPSLTVASGQARS